MTTSRDATVMAEIWVYSTDEINQPQTWVRNSHKAMGTQHKRCARVQASFQDRPLRPKCSPGLSWEDPP